MRVSKIVAGVAIAGIATFGGLSLTAPALATGGSGGSTTNNTLVDVNVENILNGNEITLLNDVSVPVAAVFCGINVNTLTAIINNTGVTECSAVSVPLVKKGWVKKAY